MAYIACLRVLHMRTLPAPCGSTFASRGIRTHLLSSIHSDELDTASQGWQPGGEEEEWDAEQDAWDTVAFLRTVRARLLKAAGVAGGGGAAAGGDEEEEDAGVLQAGGLRALINEVVRLAEAAADPAATGLGGGGVSTLSQKYFDVGGMVRFAGGAGSCGSCGAGAAALFALVSPLDLVRRRRAEVSA